MKQLYLSLVLGIFHFGDIPAQEFTFSEKIQMQINHCEYMRERFCEVELYYQGRIDAYKNVLHEIEHYRPNEIYQLQKKMENL